MTSPRSSAVASPLPDGKVLIAGGYNGSNYLATAEIFDPATNTFSAAGVGSMSTPRFDSAAAPLPDGRVLVAGGFNGTTDLASAEVFDPKTKTFSSTGIGPLSTARTGAAAAALKDGRVLVAPAAARARARTSAAPRSSAPPTPSASKLKGNKLKVTVESAGKVEVTQVTGGHRALLAKKGKRKLLKPSSASGGPGTITVTLKLTKRAKKTLKAKHKLKIKANVTFTPQGGLANTQPAKLKIKKKARKHSG